MPHGWMLGGRGACRRIAGNKTETERTVTERRAWKVLVHGLLFSPSRVCILRERRSHGYDKGHQQLSVFPINQCYSDHHSGC